MTRNKLIRVFPILLFGAFTLTFYQNCEGFDSLPVAQSTLPSDIIPPTTSNGSKIEVLQGGTQDGVPGMATFAHGATTDGIGGVYIVGSTMAALDGQTPHGQQDLFLTKYNAAGIRKFTVLDGVPGGTTNARDVKLDSAGNIYVAGSTKGAQGLDGEASSGAQDTFISKYDSTGTWIWTQQLGLVQGTLGGAANGEIVSLAIDQHDIVYALANYTYYDSSNSLVSRAFVILSYDGDGNLLSTYQQPATFGGGIGPVGLALTLDSQGRPYVSGQTDVGLNGADPLGNLDLFVVGYKSDGSTMVIIEDGAAGGVAQANNLVVDSAGATYLVGATNVGLGSQNLVGTQDVVISKYDNTGALVWTKLDGSVSSVTGAAGVGILLDSHGGLTVLSNTDQPLDGNRAQGVGDFVLAQFDLNGGLISSHEDGIVSKSNKALGVALLMDQLNNKHVVVGSLVAPVTAAGVIDSMFFFKEY